MIIKFTRKEVLKRLKWRIRRRIKKFDKKIAKNKPLKEVYDNIINEADRFLAFGLDEEENESKT